MRTPAATTPPAVMKRPADAGSTQTQTPAMPREAAILDGLLASLAGPTMANESNAVTRAYFALVEELRRAPALAARLALRLAEVDPAEPSARAMAGALAGAGTPESQPTMVHLLGLRAGDNPFLRLLVPTMGFATAASPGSDLRGSSRPLTRSARSPADLRSCTRGPSHRDLCCAARYGAHGVRGDRDTRRARQRGFAR